MKLERFEPRGRGPLALEPSAFGGLFPVMTAPTTEQIAGDVAVVSVRGPLVHHADWWCDSYDGVKGRVLAALEAKPKAIVLAVDSPGGLVSGCFDTALEIAAACESAGVPLHTYIDGLAASAGYALACVGKSVTIPVAGIAGSVGVIDGIVDATAQNTAMGLVVELVASGARKTDQNPDTKITDGARAAVKARVEELASVFFEHVATFRPLNAEQVRALEAGLFTGAGAVRAGLADRVGSLDDLVAMLASESAAPRAQGGPMTEDEKARAALKAILDDEKSDEKAKNRAKAALAAMDGEDEKKSDEPTGDEAKSKAAAASAKAAAAVAPIAKSHADIEARLAALEAEREDERKASLFAARPDVGAETRKALAHLPSAQVRTILDSMPKRVPNPAATATVPATQGATQTSGASTPTAIQPSSDGDAMDIALGRASVSSTGVVRSADGRSITLGADVVELPKKGA
jgi:ClpP class serine protease